MGGAKIKMGGARQSFYIKGFGSRLLFLTLQYASAYPRFKTMANAEELKVE